MLNSDFYERKGLQLVSQLQARAFSANYCAAKADALKLALELIPKSALVGWGGCTSAHQIGLIDALKARQQPVLDRDCEEDPKARTDIQRKCLLSDVFLTGANAISMDGQMVNIDGLGNRTAAILYGPDKVLVVAGMNKVCDSLEEALYRARNCAAPRNKQRFAGETPCSRTGVCGDCNREACICNQIVITRRCRPAGRIHFILVGEDLGF